ncbi:methyltransferase domain-containing protein [Paenalkalicoccus suaedae]|uniref:Methyltransferase domain-containing protein n=1 Tax=Paenalkalicoccus suaedae TaxID=2592382 RepID=A0A859FJR8_9BACI|nr:class I SAM-dependent methyltransferase [Paenalkalicoccus suaedae]QKS73043.1 methyltransferase domain-containing protein [Paenalkalicoccus suaedae]
MSFTNTEEYDNPELYDKENDAYTPEFALLQKWAERCEGPIVDLACGTGRLTLPLAKRGYDIIGVDSHARMLDAARKKAEALGVEVDWQEQDATKLRLGSKSSFIYCVGNSFQHFLTNEDQDGLLFSVHTHLEAGGVFVFGTRFPSAEELLQPPVEEYWRSYSDGNLEVDLSTVSRYDALDQLQHYTTIRKYKNTDGQVVDEKTTNIQLRYVFPKEMERLLEGHGFEIEAVYGDWQETPATGESAEMVYLCRRGES